MFRRGTAAYSLRLYRAHRKWTLHCRYRHSSLISWCRCLCICIQQARCWRRGNQTLAVLPALSGCLRRSSFFWRARCGPRALQGQCRVRRRLAKKYEMKPQRPAQSSWNLDLHSLLPRPSLHSFADVTQFYWCYAVWLMSRSFTDVTQICKHYADMQALSSCYAVVSSHWAVGA